MVPQFFLITPAISDVAAMRPKLDALVSTGALAVVLLRFAGDEQDVKRMASVLRRGAAPARWRAYRGIIAPA
jgi:hypothetical protein